MKKYELRKLEKQRSGAAQASWRSQGGGKTGKALGTIPEVQKFRAWQLSNRRGKGLESYSRRKETKSWTDLTRNDKGGLVDAAWNDKPNQKERKINNDNEEKERSELGVNQKVTPEKPSFHGRSGTRAKGEDRLTSGAGDSVRDWRVLLKGLQGGGERIVRGFICPQKPAKPRLERAEAG